VEYKRNIVDDLAADIVNQMNRVDRREYQRKQAQSVKITSKLTEREKNILDMFYTEKMNISIDRSWQRIETALHIVMRENRVSEERINRIFAQLVETVKKLDGFEFFDREIPKVVRMPKHRFLDLIEQKKECNGCQGKEECFSREVMLQNNVPPTDSVHNVKCPYAYLRNEKGYE
jgi:MoxR-like ATPase